MSQVLMKRMQKERTFFIICLIALALLSGWSFVEINNLKRENSELHLQIDSLEKPQLHLINFVWSDNPYGGNYRKVLANGTIFNSGSLKALGVDITIIVYDSQNNELGKEIWFIGAIEPKSYHNFQNLYVLYVISQYGSAHHVETELHFSGYG